MNGQETAQKIKRFEDGKTFYYLTVSPQKHEEVVEQPTRAPGADPRTAQQQGRHLIVRNAREMFENVDILADGRYLCRVCNRNYKTHATLTAHLRGSHLRQESPCQEKNCNHVSFTENERKKHMKVHEKNKAREFTLMNQMDRITDMRTFPDQTSDVLCEQVQRNFTEIIGMTKSLDEKGFLKFTCAECSATFSDVFSASKHSNEHQDIPKECFYCGTVRRGLMNLQVHYVRVHKNDGIRAYHCNCCFRGFTSKALFQNHMKEESSEPGCRNMGTWQEFYYGELPASLTIDQRTLDKMNLFRKRRLEKEEQMCATSSTAAPQARSTEESDIFDVYNSMIQTEFGLKKLADYMSLSHIRKRPFASTSNDFQAKRERAAQNGYYEHQQQPSSSQPQPQQNETPVEFNLEPPGYGYDPLIGRYPDFFPMQYGQPFSTFDSSASSQHTDCFGSDSGVDSGDLLKDSLDPFSRATEMATELMKSQSDVVSEELNNLDFVMPDEPENQSDDDLVDFGFKF